MDMVQFVQLPDYTKSSLFPIQIPPFLLFYTRTFSYQIVQYVEKNNLFLVLLPKFCQYIIIIIHLEFEFHCIWIFAIWFICFRITGYFNHRTVIIINHIITNFFVGFFNQVESFLCSRFYNRFKSSNIIKKFF